MAARMDKPRPDMGQTRYHGDPNLQPLIRRILRTGKLTGKDIGNFSQGSDDDWFIHQARFQDNDS